MPNELPPRILYGGDYNPDQWDDATIEKDMELFRKLHVNLVTLPVFAWAKLEPREGEYDFAWLDGILDRLDENGIGYILATPTAAQPVWMSVKYPEVLPVDIAGRRRTHGMRVFFCVNSEIYRKAAASIASAMAARYGKRRGLAAFHVCNEYGTYCYCDDCQRRFRLWLRKRYGTVEELNARWNLSFWGRTVSSFDEVFLPTELNDDYRFYPAIALDYRRFMTDSTAACFRSEYDAVKAATPDVPVFTNISGYIKKLDQFKMTAQADLVGWDNYPAPGYDPALVAFKHDLMRGLRGGQPFLLTEQSPNQQNWQPYNKLKRPGEVRMLSYQALAHGAESVLFFQMRQSRAGMEKLHGALITHAENPEDTRVYREGERLGAERDGIGAAFHGARICCRVALLFDWENWWAAELCSGPTRDLDYLAHAVKYYKAFFSRHIAVDVVPCDAPLDGYEIVLAPMLYMLKPGVSERLHAFAEKGGCVVASCFTGVVDENDRIHRGGAPGPLRDLLGLWVEETDALTPGEHNAMRLYAPPEGMRDSYACGLLCEVVRPESAQTLAVYGGDFYAGAPCLTRNGYGRGEAWYVATDPEERFLYDLASLLCRGRGLRAPLEASPEMEISVREGESGKTLFLLNHGARSETIELGGAAFADLIGRKAVTGAVTVGPGDVAVLQAAN